MHLLLLLQLPRLLLFLWTARWLLAPTLLPRSLQPVSLHPTLMGPEPPSTSELVLQD
jgi:hypothetical protein